MNDNFINAYYLFWTNFWYLTIFYFLFLFLYLFAFFNYLYFFFFLFLMCPLLGYFLEIQNFFLNNCQFIFFNFNLHEFNLFLFNNFNKYHPFILYLSSYVTLIVYFLIKIFYIKNTFFFKKVNFWNKARYFYFFIFFYSLFALFLGSWWALQEGSWGGWWNWDASETLGLLILLLFVTIVHHFNFFRTKVNNLFFYRISIYSVVVAYLFIQLNFDLVSHNFGIKFFFFFNNNLFLLELIFVFVFLSGFFINKFFNVNLYLRFFVVSRFLRFNNKLRIKRFFVYFYFTMCIQILLISFNLLINFFSWNFLNINFVNYDITLVNSTIFFIVLLSLLTIKTFFNFKIALYLLCLNNYYYLFSSFFNVLTSFRVLHGFLLLFFHFVMLSYNLEFLYWTVVSTNKDLLFDFIIFKLTNDNINLNFIFSEHCSFFFCNNFYLSNWNNDNILTITNDNFFNLFFSNNNFFNLINLNLTFSTLITLNEIMFNFNFFFSIFFFFSYLMLYFYKNIIFFK